MFGDPEQSSTSSGDTCVNGQGSTHLGAANSSPASKTDAENDEHVCHLLELAASNDLVGFQQALKEQKVKITCIGSWYGRKSGTAHMVWEKRTPTMIAALYGSVDVLEYILSFSETLGSINMKCGSDGSTTLHCAASGGSAIAVDTVKLLLRAGADLNSRDAQGRRPADVIANFPRSKHMRRELESLLKAESLGQSALLEVDVHNTFELDEGEGAFLETDVSFCRQPFVATSSSPSPFSSPETLDVSPVSSPTPSSSPKCLDSASGRASSEENEKVKEFFVDPSLPDIKNGVYKTDEFRMFSFKIRPCSRAYSHDWTECPFAHPGENARRRDPRRYHYSCVPCPEFRKGACQHGDACEYSHGVFECWLHPAQYRTRLCKDGTECERKVCFFAHTNDELRPLFISSGSTIPTSPLDMLGLSPPRTPCSPTSGLMMGAFSSTNMAQGNFVTPPVSPSSSPGNSLAATRSPSKVPALHLPGVSLQASRLRSSLNARDISLEEFSRADLRSEFDGQLVAEIASIPSHALSTQARLNAAVAAAACNATSSRYRNLGLTVPPTSLEELFSLDAMCSPKSMVQDSSFVSQMELKIPQSHAQGPIGSPKLVSISDQLLHVQQTAALESQLQGSPRVVSSPSPFSLSPLGRMTAMGGPDIGIQTRSNSAPLSPSVIAARSAFAQRDKRSHSSRDLGASLSLSDWGSPTGTLEWGVQEDDMCKFRKSASFGFRGSEEPDLAWVQRLDKEGLLDGDKGAEVTSENDSAGSLTEGVDYSALESWMENMCLDQIVA